MEESGGGGAPVDSMPDVGAVGPDSIPQGSCWTLFQLLLFSSR